MTRFRRMTLAMILGMLVPAAGAQAFDEDRRPPKKQPPQDGIWFTPTMIERFIDRLTEDDLAKTYGFDADQIVTTQELFKERFPAWLNTNRGELQGVLNEYVETLLLGEPPSQEQVAQWAQRALPLLLDFQEEFNSVAEEMRTYMTQEQQVILDGQLAATGVGFNFMERRLRSWGEGGFDPETEWHRNEKFREAQRKRDEEARVAMEAAKARATGQDPAVTQANQQKIAAARNPTVKDEWSKYVDDFIKRYQLNDEQKQQAQRYLKAAQDQRQKFVQRNGDALAKAEDKLKQAKTESERAEAIALADQLTQQLDRMFTVLKEKLDTLPTRKQRELAAAAEPKKSGEVKPASGSGGAGTGAVGTRDAAASPAPGPGSR